VSKKLGKGLASAIEKGETATKATKETVSEYNVLCPLTGRPLMWASSATATGTAKEKTKEGAEVAGQKANQVCPFNFVNFPWLIIYS
jgi:hypothetical protein